MIPILSIEDFEKTALEKKHNCVVGLMLAPYNHTYVKTIIDQYYNEWHYTSGDAFDMYWMGYGKQPYEPQQRRLDLGGVNIEHTYFDIKMFCGEINTLNQRVHFTYRNDFELILFNCYRGKINYNDHIRVQLDEFCMDEDDEQLRDLIASIIDYVKKRNTIDDLKKLIKNKKRLLRLSKVNWKDVIGLIK